MSNKGTATIGEETKSTIASILQNYAVAENWEWMGEWVNGSTDEVTEQVQQNDERMIRAQMMGKLELPSFINQITTPQKKSFIRSKKVQQLFVEELSTPRLTGPY